MHRDVGINVYFYDGNRGRHYNLADKIEVLSQEAEQRKPTSWWYKSASGGGCPLDDLGYGATLRTCFLDGETPIEATSTAWSAPALGVDEHSVTVLRYEHGLSKMETRWVTFADPWTIRPQTKRGFIVVDTEGTIASHDYDDHVTVQTRWRPELTPIPNDPVAAHQRGPVEYLPRRHGTGKAVTDPRDSAIARIGLRIVDTALVSVHEKCTFPLLG